MLYLKHIFGKEANSYANKGKKTSTHNLKATSGPYAKGKKTSTHNLKAISGPYANKGKKTSTHNLKATLGASVPLVGNCNNMDGDKRKKTRASNVKATSRTMTPCVNLCDTSDCGDNDDPKDEDYDPKEDENSACSSDRNLLAPSDKSTPNRKSKPKSTAQPVAIERISAVTTKRKQMASSSQQMQAKRIRDYRRNGQASTDVRPSTKTFSPDALHNARQIVQEMQQVIKKSTTKAMLLWKS